MRRMVAAIALLLMSMMSVAHAQEARDPEGHWTMTSRGQVLMRIDVTRDSTAEGGWHVVWTRPAQFLLNRESTVLTKAEGGSVTQVAKSAESGETGLHVLFLSPRSTRTEAMDFTIQTDGSATLGWTDTPGPTLIFQRSDTAAPLATLDPESSYPIDIPGAADPVRITGGGVAAPSDSAPSEGGR